MYINYLKTAWRYLTKNKVSSIINILGLALGITCCLIIFLITKHELSYDTFHPDKERIYRLSGTKSPGMLDPMLASIRDEITGLDVASTIWYYNTKVRIAGRDGEKYFEEPRSGFDPVDIIVTDPVYFDIFKYEWLAGSPASLNAPNMVVLSLDKAAKYFGDLPVDRYIGQEITYGESLLVSVAGIVNPWKKNTDFPFTDFVSSASIAGSELSSRINMDAWGMWNSSTQIFVKLLPGIDPATVEAQFPAWGEKYIFYAKENPNAFKLILQPLADIHFNTEIKNPYTQQAHLPTLYGLMAIAAFILIIAVCNFINLYTAQSMQRVKEIGVRKVVGGKRGDLIIQFLGETLLVTLFAAAIAMLFVKPVVTVFQSFVPQGMTQGLLQPVTLLFLVGIILVTTLLAGFYPAKLSSGVSPISIMKGGTLQKNSRNLLRKSLIVFQFTISLVLIICTMIVGDQIRYLMNKDLGFTQDAILNIRLRGGVANREVFAEKLKQFPFVEMVGFHNNPPAAQAHNGTLFKYNKQGEEIEVTGAIEFCDENYIPMYNVQLVAGRNLLPSRYMREAVINESFARQLGFNDPQDAIGELIWSGQQDRLPDDVPPPEGQRLLQIVGVTADFHYNPLYEKIGPMLMSATSQVGRSMSVKLTMAGKSIGDTRKILADIEKTYKELNPYERYEATFYDDSIAAFYEKEQRTVNIISAAMLMAIFISCMGLFGLVMFTTKQRTKEIGIRKVFGASIYDVLLLLSGGFVKLVILSVLIASPVAWYAMSKWMESFAYHVPLRWWLFILAGLLAIIITLATISLQTIKVARANPVEAIKSE